MQTVLKKRSIRKDEVEHERFVQQQGGRGERRRKRDEEKEMRAVNTAAAMPLPARQKNKKGAGMRKLR